MPVCWRQSTLRCLGSTWLAFSLVVGCGSAGSEHGDARAAAYANVNEATVAFDAHDYATAELKLASALASKLLNPDVFCESTVKHAVCLSAAGKHDEALAALDTVGVGASNADQVESARSYILAKQGKASESRAALAKARRLNPKVQEFKD